MTILISTILGFGVGAFYTVTTQRKRGMEIRDLGSSCMGFSPEKWSICVSSSLAVAGLSDTITEEPVSCDSAGETPQGLAG